jgi:Eco57I restriction-modification methylase
MRTKKPIPVSDIEKITKQFYERFRMEHNEFQHCIQDIADQHDCEWYTSLMLNRLMFLYFIQQKGFLAGDKDYLYNRLKMVQGLCKGEGQPRLYGILPDGQDPCYSFYRCFLLKLFQDGLNEREHSPTLGRLLGNVPYLNSGLFAMHVLERKYPAIEIPDSAFERLFDFFQEYGWYLDDDLDAPSHRGGRQGQAQSLQVSPSFGINPDMLGSIFERFINQKEKGAYYTKDDVTEYISKNTIIPSIFEAVEKRCPEAFGPSGPVWSLLRANFDDYIYMAVAKENMGGDKPTLLHIRDLITYNLDICKFARNVIVSCERSDLLLAFYESIEATTILDPTCGSGAFLFAALRILCPLYEACLIRMQAMVNEYDQPDIHIEPQKCYQTYQIERFCDILQQAHNNQSRKYFILKSIITKNLYGVDLMEEAVEICKLRLFLKLLAQVDGPEDCREGRLSPSLSDIDFNVLVGNALVGCVSTDGYSVGAAACPCPASPSTPPHEGRRGSLSLPSRRSEGSQIPTPEGVATLQRPFHWCVEFQRIIKSGGFSVIIGNPPYVEYNAAKFPYTLHHFATLACANLYPCVVERSHQLLSPQGYTGMILPLAAFATRNMIPFIEGFYHWFPRSWLSFYHFRPSMLFSGGKVASIPTAIFLAQATGPEQRFSTNLIKWSTDKRDQLFSRLMYCPVTGARDGENRHYYPKFGHSIENTIMEKILRHQRVETCLAKTPNQNTMWYRSAGGLYWKVFVNFPWPYETTSNKQCSFHPSYERDVFVALFNSSLFWWYYTVTFDSFNLKDYMLFGFRFSYPQDTTLIHALCSCCQRLMSNFRANAQHLKRGKTGSYTVYARKAKHIIDDIDRILAHHYGFTEKELDFIINYDITYRMGYDNRDKSEGEFG